MTEGKVKGTGREKKGAVIPCCDRTEYVTSRTLPLSSTNSALAGAKLRYGGPTVPESCPVMASTTIN